MLELVRKGALHERYALLWLFAAAVIIGLAAWPRSLDWVAGRLGVHYAPSLLFLVAILFAYALLLHYSVVLSRMHARITRLAQEVALLRQALEQAASRENSTGGKHA